MQANKATNIVFNVTLLPSVGIAGQLLHNGAVCSIVRLLWTMNRPTNNFISHHLFGQMGITAVIRAG
jgi:hypothetical protein